MRNLFFLFIFIFVMNIVVSTNAELYEYRDADGNIRFTDDLGNVPEDRRENIIAIQGISTPPMVYGKQDASPEIAVLKKDGDIQEQTSADLNKMGEALWQEQAALQEEYNNIEKAKTLLGEPPGKEVSRKKVDEYVSKVNSINDKILDYQKKLEDHESRVEEYNARFVK